MPNPSLQYLPLKKCTLVSPKSTSKQESFFGKCLGIRGKNQIDILQCYYKEMRKYESIYLIIPQK
jgi:hypothetical protein